MMGGGAFLLLKVGRNGPESAKQAEIRLAILPKILSIGRPGGPSPSPRGGRTCDGGIFTDFRWVWLILRESPTLLFRSQF
jgi:hypothetical protein